MEILLTIAKLKSSKLTPNQLILLYLLYYQKFEDILEIFGKEKSLAIRNSLESTEYLLSSKTKFRETLISKKHVEKLLNIRSDQINFWEFYNCYPVKVGTRILRSAGPTTQVALKHEKKYLAKVKTIKNHALAIRAITAFVAKKKFANELQYLPNMETVMNNSLWEQWEIFIQETGKEEQEWNTETI
jgi:hypothetical protein